MLIKKSPTSIRNVKKVGVYIGVPGLGDLLFIIPLFRALKKLFPDAETVFIGQLQRDYVLPVFNNCPYIDRLMEFHFYESLTAGRIAGFISALRREKFDVLADTQRKFMPSMLLALGGARYMVSYSSNEVFSDFKVNVRDRDKRHTADISLDLARALGSKDPSLELEIGIPRENLDYAVGFYSEHGVAREDKLAGLIPSAGHPSRRWNSEKFGALAGRLASELGCKLICFGSASDKQVIDEIAGHSPVPLLVEDFSRRSILDSAALMQRCDVIIGVDSGPMHVADATGAPCIGLYGPTLPERFGLLGRGARQICLYKECSPCGDPVCAHRKCMEEISVETVFDAVRATIGH